MPNVYLPKIGEVEYVPTRDLPSGVKGKTLIGELTAPILITEDLGPGAKLDYVVAHEIGHRLTLDMMVNANKERPDIFQEVPADRPTAALVRYFTTLGLRESDLQPLHPGTRFLLHRIFEDNTLGKWTPEDTAREFVAEVYAGWATVRGHTPPELARRFKMLTDSKNEILRTKIMPLKGQEAAFTYNPTTNEADFRLTVVGLLGLVALVFILR